MFADCLQVQTDSLSCADGAQEGESSPSCESPRQEGKCPLLTPLARCSASNPEDLPDVSRYRNPKSYVFMIANRGQKGDGILFDARQFYPSRLAHRLLHYFDVCTFRWYSLSVQLQERRGVQRILPLVGVIHKRVSTHPLVRRPRRTTWVCTRRQSPTPPPRAGA